MHEIDYKFMTCVICRMFRLINDSVWYNVPDSGDLFRAIKYLSRKTLCNTCEKELMKGVTDNVGDTHSLSVRKNVGYTTTEQRVENDHMPCLQNLY